MKKSLAIIIRFFDEKKMSVVDKFLVNKTVFKCLEDVGIPLANIIGFASDNASVMMGNINGVQAQFRKMVPHIFILGCVIRFIFVHRRLQINCQNLLKISREAYITIFRIAVINSRIKELTECQTFVNLKPHKMLRPSQTRWLSLQVSFRFYNNYIRYLKKSVRSIFMLKNMISCK